MEVVEIRQKVILDAMLDGLGLPKSTHEATMNTDDTFTVSLMFFPSARMVTQPNGRYSCESGPHYSVLAAENKAVYEAIQYMECCQRKTPKDYSYARVQGSHDSEARLFLQVTKKYQQIQELTNNWDSFVGGVRLASEKIEEIIQANLTELKKYDSFQISSVFLELARATSDLKQLVRRSTELLQTTGLRSRGERSFDDEVLNGTDSACDAADHLPDHYPASSPSPPYSMQNFCLDDEALCDADDLYSMDNLHL